MSNSAEKSC